MEETPQRGYEKGAPKEAPYPVQIESEASGELLMCDTGPTEFTGQQTNSPAPSIHEAITSIGVVKTKVKNSVVFRG